MHNKNNANNKIKKSDVALIIRCYVNSCEKCYISNITKNVYNWNAF